jgi:hypothetical protein
VSNEAKISIAVAALALVALVWFAAGPRSEPDTSAAPSRGASRPAGGRSARVKERLEQLRAERLAAAGNRATGGGSIPGKLAPPRFGDLPSEQAADAEPAPESGEPDEMTDLEFEELRDAALIDEDPDSRIAAIWLLASLEDEEPVLPVLTQALSDENPEVRMAAIQALSEFSEETPIDSLTMALQDSDAEIRFEALSIAAEMSDERVQPLIEQALDDPDEDVRSLAEGLADMEESYDPAPTVAAR